MAMIININKKSKVCVSLLLSYKALVIVGIRIGFNNDKIIPIVEYKSMLNFLIYLIKFIFIVILIIINPCDRTKLRLGIKMIQNNSSFNEIDIAIQPNLLFPAISVLVASKSLFFMFNILQLHCS